MGVPRFYRWASERYPLINHAIGNGEATPVVDNLYLDLNGVVHNAAKVDDALRPVMSEEDILLNAFRCIDILVNLIRPLKLVYFAVDGVAPRAKMNHQRARRFRSAKERAEEMAKAAEVGLKQSASFFDSNCITPGTEFMEKLTQGLRYFIEKKIAEDSMWGRFEVILSGAEAPGEGEHKIMDYIRQVRGSGQFGGNTRHCMYGLDADLVLLALLTHEPHFLLLREKVDFKSFMKKGRKKEQSKLDVAFSGDYELLSIGVLRDYINTNFSALEIPFYDVEHIIDDIVFLSFLVGNDFLPHLPALDIGEGALDLVIRMYECLIPRMGGYITDRGSVNFSRLQIILAELGRIEGDILYRREMSSKKGKRGRKGPAIDIDDLWNQEDIDVDTLVAPLDKKLHVRDKLRDSDDEELLDMLSTPAADTTTENHDLIRQEYYKSKFGFSANDEEAIAMVRKAYVEGLLWTIQYYFQSVTSWRWFYPYHFAPLVVDLVNLESVATELPPFELGTAFLPMQQLMAVLPPSSSWALPLPYQRLMLSEKSPLQHMYPKQFQIDQNGKRNPWEGVVLLPFVDEEELLSGIATINVDELSEKERKRNTHGPSLVFKRLSPDEMAHVKSRVSVDSPVPKRLPPILSAAKHHILKLPVTGSKGFAVMLPHGFIHAAEGIEDVGRWPTLETLPHCGSPSKIQVNVFGMPSTRVLVDYPFMVEAKVVSVLDKDEVIGSSPEDGGLLATTHRSSEFTNERVITTSVLMETRGLNVIDTLVLVRVNLPASLNMVTGAVESFSDIPKTYPAHLVLPWFPRSKELEKLEDIVVGGRVLYVGAGPFQGQVGLVEELLPAAEYASESSSSRKARIRFPIPKIAAPEIPFSHRLVEQAGLEQWFSLRDLTSSLKLSPVVASKILGSLRVWTSEYQKDSFDIGLGVKFAKAKVVMPGYARRVPPKKMVNAVQGIVFEFSSTTKTLLSNYQKAFPEVFVALEFLLKQGGPDTEGEQTYRLLETLSGNAALTRGKQILSRVAKFLAAQETARLPLIPCESSVLPRATVSKLTLYTARMLRRQRLLAEQSADDPALSADDKSTEIIASFEDLDVGTGRKSTKKPLALGDRVTNRHVVGPVPLGLRGTVVGLHAVESEAMCEVVYDEGFLGGGNLGSRCIDGRGKAQAQSTLLRLELRRLTPKDDLSRDIDVPESESYSVLSSEKTKERLPSKAEESSPLQSTSNLEVGPTAAMDKRRAATAAHGKSIAATAQQTFGSVPTTGAMPTPEKLRPGPVPEGSSDKRVAQPRKAQQAKPQATVAVEKRVSADGGASRSKKKAAGKESVGSVNGTKTTPVGSDKKSPTPKRLLTRGTQGPPSGVDEEEKDPDANHLHKAAVEAFFSSIRGSNTDTVTSNDSTSQQTSETEGARRAPAPTPLKDESGLQSSTGEDFDEASFWNALQKDGSAPSAGGQVSAQAQGGQRSSMSNVESVSKEEARKATSASKRRQKKKQGSTTLSRRDPGQIEPR